MNYRRMGNSGIRISEIGLGSWMTYGEAVNKETSKKCFETALENGVNFIDTADIYANGKAEEIIGEFLVEETFTRKKLVISSKVYWEMSKDVNDCGLGRKHIRESIDASLERLDLDYLDIYFAHYYDQRTDLRESISTMHDLISEGKIHYWGTSVHTAAQIERVISVAKELNARFPKVEQPRYNMLDRYIELEVVDVCNDYSMGIVVWSPLMYGLLTGKYNEDTPDDSRFANLQFKRGEGLLADDLISTTIEITKTAEDMSVKPSQLALAWILHNKCITSAITGSTKPEQIIENLKAVEVAIPPEKLEIIEKVLDNKPKKKYPYDTLPFD